MPTFYSTAAYRRLAVWLVAMSLVGQLLHPLLHGTGCDAPDGCHVHRCGAPAAGRGPGVQGPVEHQKHPQCPQCVVCSLHTTAVVTPTSIDQCPQRPTPLMPHQFAALYSVDVLVRSSRAPPGA